MLAPINVTKSKSFLPLAKSTSSLRVYVESHPRKLIEKIRWYWHNQLCSSVITSHIVSVCHAQRRLV